MFHDFSVWKRLEDDRIMISAVNAHENLHIQMERNLNSSNPGYVISAYLASVPSSLNVKIQARRKIDSEVAVHTSRLVSLCSHQQMRRMCRGL
jgi:hypothetical protein